MDSSHAFAGLSHIYIFKKLLLFIPKHWDNKFFTWKGKVNDVKLWLLKPKYPRCKWITYHMMSHQ